IVGPNPVFEFAQTLPVDTIKADRRATASDLLAIHPDARLSPIDCSLVSEFVAAGAAGPVSEEPTQEPTDEPVAGTCEGRCGQFTLGASCQCDENCATFNNCCADMATVCE